MGKRISLLFVPLFGEAHLGISTSSKAETRNAVRPTGYFAVCIRSLNCVAFSFLGERRKAHFEFSVNAHYIFSGESEDFCEAEITAFKTYPLAIHTHALIRVRLTPLKSTFEAFTICIQKCIQKAANPVITRKTT